MAKKKLRKFRVSYKILFHGTAEVEAESQDAAELEVTMNSPYLDLAQNASDDADLEVTSTKDCGEA